MTITTNTAWDEPQEPELSFAVRAYRLDRADDAESYCDYLSKVIALIQEMQAAVSHEEQREDMLLLSEVKKRIQSWPVHASLDVTEEAVDSLVRNLLLNLDIEGQLFSTQSAAAILQVLAILQDAYLEADQYREATDD